MNARLRLCCLQRRIAPAVGGFQIRRARLHAGGKVDAGERSLKLFALWPD